MGFLESLRPMFPWEGLPLPFFLGFYWPWTQSPSSTSTSPLAGNSPAPPQITRESTPAYENREEIEFPEGFDPDTLMPLKIVVRRKYKMRVDE